MGKIGIMGGTFDPIHNGHLMLGEYAFHEYELDQVWYMPSKQPPHKADHFVTDIFHRCDMTKLAIIDYPYFIFSDFEVWREGYSYTSQTLMLLNQKYPEHTFYFIIGADSLFEIEKWYLPHEIMLYATLIAAGRLYKNAVKTMEEQIHYLSDKYHAKILKLHCPEMDISSIELRKKISHGEAVNQYVPKTVAEYITANHLYQE